MLKQIIASIDKDEERLAVLKDGVLDEFYVERTKEPRSVGNIYLGRVTNIAHGIEAAFVDIGLEKDGFLYVDDVISPSQDYGNIMNDELKDHGRKRSHKGSPKIKDLLKVNQEVMVQVVKEPISTKGARLITHITFPGKYVVYMPYETHKGISKKIESREDRKRLKAFLSSLKLSFPGGLIARTQSVTCKREEFITELKYLATLWKRISKQASKSKAPCRLYEEHDLVLRVVRDIFDDTFESMFIDSRDVFKRAMQFVKSTSPHLKKKLKLYNRKIPVFETYKIDREIDKIYQRRVFLKCGGHLVVDETEGMVVIDVNSGSAVKGKNLEETVFRVNKEAATEIARQIKLRDLGGIIVIDFIDMESRDNREKLLNVFKDALKSDKAKINVLSISKIGLVEMTRQRMRKSVESLSYQTCPYCAGRGLVKSIPTVAIYTMREVESVMKSNRRKTIEIHLHPEVARYISDNYREQLKALMARYKNKVTIKSESKFHIEGLDIIPR